MTNSFDFFSFHEANNIIEVSINSEVEIEDYKIKIKKYREKLNDWDEKVPPPPPPHPDEFIEQNVTILSSFKGNNSKISRIRIYGINSSCYWKPDVGSVYILYLGESLNLSEDEEVLVIDGCQRRINYNNRNFNSEKKVLKKLKNSGSKRFKIDQSELVLNSNEKIIILSGRFRNGKMHGSWIIREPILGEEKTNWKPLKYFHLKFKNGKLQKLRKMDDSKLNLYGELKILKEYFFRSWYANLSLNY